MTGDSEVIHLEEKHLIRAVEELHQVAATRTQRQLTVPVDSFLIADQSIKWEAFDSEWLWRCCVNVVVCSQAEKSDLPLSKLICGVSCRKREV
jgi:hypothetical protein